MTHKSAPSRTTAGAGGPVVAVCRGHRCVGLHRMAGTAEQVENLQEVVKATAGAVLISSPCLGRCEMASLVAVARRDGPSGQVGPTVWLSGLEEPHRVEALSRWIASGGPQRIHQPEHGAPEPLQDAVSGFGPPPTVSRRAR
ncbi:hypothetical protein [Kocuria aegyptia]|uniref:(2Fe-2S) ferredoxin domain-containing protein n=1 Tax=Kocuria aegyptia TaxID=330943 RepID=A0ABN2K8E2_9MICC